MLQFCAIFLLSLCEPGCYVFFVGSAVASIIFTTLNCGSKRRINNQRAKNSTSGNLCPIPSVQDAKWASGRHLPCKLKIPDSAKGYEYQNPKRISFNPEKRKNSPKISPPNRPVSLPDRQTAKIIPPKSPSLRRIPSQNAGIDTESTRDSETVNIENQGVLIAEPTEPYKLPRKSKSVQWKKLKNQSVSTTSEYTRKQKNLAMKYANEKEFDEVLIAKESANELRNPSNAPTNNKLAFQQPAKSSQNFQKVGARKSLSKCKFPEKASLPTSDYVNNMLDTLCKRN